MSYNLYNEDDEFKPPPTPILEIEVIKEGESYSCTECSSDIEITSIDESSNILSFKCPLHGAKAIPIKDYLNDMKKILIYIANVILVKSNKIKLIIMKYLIFAQIVN